MQGKDVKEFRDSMDELRNKMFKLRRSAILVAQGFNPGGKI